MTNEEGFTEVRKKAKKVQGPIECFSFFKSRFKTCGVFVFVQGRRRREEGEGRREKTYLHEFKKFEMTAS